MIKDNSFLFILISLSLLFANSCRVEVIEPNNPAGNTNIPLKTDKENYFDVVINANSLTTDMTFDMNFNSETNNISLGFNDVTTGRCSLSVIGNNGRVLYNITIQTGNINIIQRINRGIPSKVRLVFDNFTAKIRIMISKSSF